MWIPVGRRAAIPPDRRGRRTNPIDDAASALGDAMTAMIPAANPSLPRGVFPQIRHEPEAAPAMAARRSWRCDAGAWNAGALTSSRRIRRNASTRPLSSRFGSEEPRALNAPTGLPHALFMCMNNASLCMSGNLGGMIRRGRHAPPVGDLGAPTGALPPRSTYFVLRDFFVTPRYASAAWGTATRVNVSFNNC